MRKILLATSLMIGATSLAMANETASDEWEFSATPLFLWGLSVDGSSTIGDTTAPLNLDFSDDILENMEAVFTLHFEARKSKWVLFSEVQYVELDPSSEISQDSPPASVEDDIDFTNTMVELGVGYAFVETAKSRWEVIGGARYTRQELEVDVDLSPPGPGPSIAVDSSVDEDWWHGFAGGRLIYSLTDYWTFEGRADYGYGDSDNTATNASFFFNYKFNDWGSVLAGFRYLDYDYDNDRSGNNHYAYDAKQQGPLLGLTIRW
jgi:hypothetical protein